MYEYLKESILLEENKALGIDNRKRKETEKLSGDLENMIKEKEKAYMWWLADKKPESRQKYVQMMQLVNEQN